MPIPTSTPSTGTADGGTAVAVLAIERTAAGGVAIVDLRRGARVAPRILDRGAGVVHAAFIPTQAGPVAGDRDSTLIVVGAGATLIVEPVAATLALPGAARTLLTLDVTVRAGRPPRARRGPADRGGRRSRSALLSDRAGRGRGGGAARDRRARPGRDGEPPGSLDSVTRVTLDGRALLHDGLRFEAGIDALHVALSPVTASWRAPACSASRGRRCIARCSATPDDRRLAQPCAR